MTAEQKAKLYKTEDTGLYLVVYSFDKSKWELRRKLADTERTLFLESCKFKTALLVLANNLQSGMVNA